MNRYDYWNRNHAASSLCQGVDGSEESSLMVMNRNWNRKQTEVPVPP